MDIPKRIFSQDDMNFRSQIKNMPILEEEDS